MATLANSRMEEGSDPDIFFRNIDQISEELERLGEYVSQHRKLDVILSGISSGYETIKVQVMKDPYLTLEDMKLTVQNMQMNGLVTSGRRGRGSAMTAGPARRESSKVRCYSCGELGHYKSSCTKAGGSIEQVDGSWVIVANERVVTWNEHTGEAEVLSQFVCRTG